MVKASYLERGWIWMIRPGFSFDQRYHVDGHGELSLKQLRLSVVNIMHTNYYRVYKKKRNLQLK